MTSPRLTTRGAIRRRAITCLQTIDVGRLTSDPVFLTPGGLIAVTGQGPVDSNQSSKTTFEAALSLIHGDPGWRQESPQFSSYATELLFNPPNAPTGTRVRADAGYIVAVFTTLAGHTSGQLLGGEPITVWIRLRRHDDPAFEVTTTPGVRLACGETHAQRIEDAKRVWANLRGPKWGPQRYAKELYGPGVSCLSYVSTRGGRSEQRTTLLGSDISQLSPEQIAGQLVDLAGMRLLFDNEATQREEFFRLTQQLVLKQEAVKTASATVTAFETENAALDRRIDLLDRAARARDRFVAETVEQILTDLATLAEQRAIAAHAFDGADAMVEKVSALLDRLDPAAVQQAVSDAAGKLRKARETEKPVADRNNRLHSDLEILERDLSLASEAADTWSGRPLETIIAEHNLAQGQLIAATAAMNRTEGRRDKAEEHLQAVRRGQAGPAGDRLTQANIPWQLLHDGLELDDPARPLYEPLLAPYDDALCVPSEHLAAATQTLAGFPGTPVLGWEGDLPAGVRAAPAGAAGLLAWLAEDGRQLNDVASLEGRIAIIGGYPEPTTGRAAREALARSAFETAQNEADTAKQAAGQAADAERQLAEEREAAEAEVRRAALAHQQDDLRKQAAALADELAPLRQATEAADAAHRDALAETRSLQSRRAEVSSHLASCKSQVTEQKKKLDDVLNKAAGHLLPTWATYLDTCDPDTGDPVAPQVSGQPSLDLPETALAATEARVREVLANQPAGPSHRDLLTRLETDLGFDVQVTVVRHEQRRVTVAGGEAASDPLTISALQRYHEQALNADRIRNRNGEAREVEAFDAAVVALKSGIERQTQGIRDALVRARADHAKLQREYDAAYDEVHATDANLRNLQRGLEHQVRGLFTSVSKRFNEIRFRDGGHGGDLDFQITPPTLEAPEIQAQPGRGWILTATPRWARRPADGGSPEHVPYHEQANTAQYKLATVQLVLSALLANEDPLGRMLILDELGDGLGDAHRERVLEALKRAAEETGITIMATVQDDLQHEAFTRCREVLVLRYRSEADLLNEPTYMFAGNQDEDGEFALIPLAEALTSGRGPGWSQLLAVYDAATAADAMQRRARRDAS